MTTHDSQKALNNDVTYREHEEISLSSAQGLRTLLDMCERDGISTHALLEGTRLTHELLNDPETLIYRHQEALVLENLVNRNSDPALAFRAGTRQRISTLGTLGYAVVTSRTVRDAILVGLRYSTLTTRHCTVTMEESGDEGMLIMDARNMPEQLRPFVVDWDMAALFMCLHDVMQEPGMVKRIWIDHPPAAPDELYLQAVKCAPSFNKPANIITFDRRLLDIRLPLYNLAAHQQALKNCDEEMARYRAMTNCGGRVRDYLLRGAADMPTLEDVAKAFLTTPRTLRRRLAEEETTFREILEGVRHDLATQRLRDTKMSIQEISLSLGYRDMATFSTAFKRWKGLTPGAFRKGAVKETLSTAGRD